MTLLSLVRIRAFATFAAALLMASIAIAQPTTTALKPGDYVTEGSGGSLMLKPGKGGALQFSISVVGANGHSCELDGDLRNGRATLEGTDEKKPCIVTMKSTRAGIEVNGKTINLGNFKGEDAAALAYNKAARKHFGSLAYQNQIGRKSNNRRD